MAVVAVATAVTACATIVLALATWFYLQETQKHRLLAQKVVSLDTSPMVYAKLGELKGKLDNKNRKFNVRTYITIKNGGKVRVQNVRLDYELQHDNKSVKGTRGPLQYLFPGEDSSHATALVSIPFSPEEYSRLREAVEQSKPYPIKLKDKFERLRLNIDISYEDIAGKKIPLSYSCRYSTDQEA